MGKVKFQFNNHDEALSTKTLACGLELFSNLIHAKLYSETREESQRKFEIHQGFMSDVMKDCSLSDWIELYVRVIFSSVYQAPKQFEKEFFQAVRCIHAEALRQEILKQLKNHADDLQCARHTSAAYMTKSFFSLSRIMEDMEQAADKIQRISFEVSHHRENTLSAFILIARIVGLAERIPALSDAKFQQFKTKMANHPFRVMGELSKILKDAVTLNTYDVEYDVLFKLDKIIHATLEGLGFKDDNKAAASLIREALFEKKWVIFSDTQIPSCVEESEIHISASI